MIRRTLFFVLLLTAAAYGKDPKSAKATDNATAPGPVRSAVLSPAAPGPVLKVPDGDALAIRDVQVQYLLTLQQLKDLEQQRKQQFVVLQQKMAEAYAHAKLDPADFDMDDQKWEFIAKPKPTSAAAKPAPAEPKK